MKHLLFFLFFLPIVLLQAQSHNLFLDEFDDDSGGWLVGNFGQYETKIEGGKYIFKNNSSSGRYLFKQIPLDPKEDFVIGMKLRIVIDSKGNENGIVWGWEENNKNLFTITNKGYFQIYYYRDDERIPIVKATKSEHIKTGAEFNTLAVAKKGEKVFYFVNGQVVHQDYFAGIKGAAHGFLLWGNRVEVDKFNIKHPPIKINLVDNPINGYVKENLGTGINSYAGEISPKVSADGSLLFVCRGGHRSNTGASVGYDQDAWFAEKVDEENWGILKNLGKPVNDEMQNAVAAISADNNTLMLNYDGRSDPGLMISHRNTTGWSAPTRVYIEDFYNRNKDTEFSLAPNGKVLVFSADRKDTHGEKDLYVSFRNSDGTWSKPKNLGAKINTYTTDFGPFLAADNTTLYFASMGHPGYGSSDVFVTKRLDDTWTNWSTPKNLGPEINTKNWDAYYTITASGEEAYMATAGAYGSTDIFKIKLEEKEENEDAKPDPVVLIKGKVFDQKTNLPLAATISYSDIKTGKEVGIARSDPRTGRYQISLPYGTHYDFIAEATGYAPISENIDLRRRGRYSEKTQNLYLAPLEVGEVVSMKNIFFKVASATLLEDSYAELDRMAKLMKENKTMTIKVIGHTDSLGPIDRLQQLSEQRAKSIHNYLVGKGLPADRVKWEGKGGSEPIADNKDPEERKKNRRVEFEILKN